MSNLKELKSIDVASYTVIMTGISVIFAIISAISLSIGLYLISPGTIPLIIYLIPTIIIATLMFGIYNNFFDSYLYNVLVKKLNTIKLGITDNQISKISTTETAIMVSIVATIQVIFLYLVTTLVLPIFLSGLFQIFMMTGQILLATIVYEFIAIISSPTITGIIILGVFLMSFVFTLLGTYIYNLLAKSGRGAVVELSKENEMTVIDSVNTVRLAIVIGVIGGVLNLIIAIILIITGANIMSLIGNIIGGFISYFVQGALLAIFYNFLAPKIGKLKLELVDC